MANDAVIKLGLDVQGVKKGLDKVQKELKETAKSAAKLDAVQKEMRQIRTESKKLAAALNKSKVAAQKNAAAMSGTKSGLAGLKSGFIAVAAAVGTAYVAVRALDSAFELSAKVEAMETALANLAGDSERAAAALTAVGNATNGTVSKMESMRIANTLLNFGIAKNADEMEELATIGATLGRSMGLTATKGVEDFSLAIARGSRKILDNLGIILDQEEAYKIHAATLDKNVDQLTKAEKAQSFFVAAMIKGREKVEAMGGAIKTNADNWLAMKAGMEDAKASLSTTIASNVKLGEAIEKVSGYLSDNIDGFANWAGGAITAIIEVVTALKEADDIISKFTGFRLLMDTMDNYAKTSDNALDITGEMGDSFETARLKIAHAEEEIKRLGERMEDGTIKGGNYTRQLAEQNAEIVKQKLTLKGLSKRHVEIGAQTAGLTKLFKANASGATAAAKAFGKLGDVEGEVTTDTVELTKAQKDLKKALDEVSGSAARYAELAGEVQELDLTIAEQGALLKDLASGADAAQAALTRMWAEGLITDAGLYNTLLGKIKQNQADIAEDTEGFRGSNQDFLDSIGGGGDVETKRTEGGALGKGGFADFAANELGSTPTAADREFEEDTGFQLSNVLDPDFDKDTALETWDEVSTALEDRTISMADANEKLAIAGFNVDGAFGAQVVTMAKAAKAAQKQAMLMNLVGRAAGNLAGGLMRMAISGEGSFKKLLNAELSSLAQSSAAKAVSELAAGFAANAIGNSKGAAEHFTAAAFYGKVALIAGVGAIATGGGGGSGDSSGDDTAQDSSNDRDIARTTDAADDNQAGGPNVSVIFDGASFVGEPTSEQLALITSAVEQATSNAGGGNSLRGG